MKANIKMTMIVISLALGILPAAVAKAGPAVAKASAQVVQCAGKIQGKTEFFKARINAQKRLTWFSKTRLVEAEPDSYFGWLSRMQEFGLEGSGSFVGKHGYTMLSVTNPLETVTLGLSPKLDLGFYSYRSGSDTVEVPLACSTSGIAKR